MSGKMTIKPFKLPVPMDKTTASSLWNSLELSIDQIYKKKNSELSFEILYRAGYNLVLQKHGEMLYLGVTASFRSHTLQALNALLKESDQKLLSAILKTWEEHHTAICMIRDIVMYMDRTYIPQQKLIPVYETGLSIFRATILNNLTIKNKLQSLLLTNISNERNGELIDIPTMKGILNMFIELGVTGEKVYENEFECFFLSQTKLYYQHESNECINQYSCIEYVQKVETRFRQEYKRCVNYLAKSTESKLITTLEVELINNHAETLVNMEKSGCAVMLQENNISHLKQLCQLFSRVPLKLQLVRECISEFIKKVGCEILADQEKAKDKPVVFVESILALKDKFDQIIQLCLQNEQKSLRVLKESFEEFMNKDNRTAAFLALYVDDLMKTGSKEMSETETEDKLDKVIVIFRYINDKDVFEAFYKNFLSKRLLSGKGFNDELERTMISKLKSECGYQFTSKLEGMFTDIRLSKATLEEYMKASGTMGRSCPFEVDITILTAGFWPSSTESLQCIIPPALMLHCTDPFSAYYFSTHTGRKLYWQFQLGSADLKGSFQEGKRELTVSTYQMFILLLFNEYESLTLHEIRERTNIPENELRRHLLSLCTPKFKILSKLSKIKGIAEDDTFTFNNLYTSKLKRVKIPLISQKEFGGVDENEKSINSLPPSVEEDRRHLIEAAIVRIMKARKTLSHNDLLSETMRQSAHRFAVEAQFVKKRIESLIEREYLVRDKADRRIYHYQA